MEDLVALAPRLVAAHPAVTGVAFAGSRSRGTHHELSDWDFAVETPDFGAVAAAMPRLVAPLEPLGRQWEPMGIAAAPESIDAAIAAFVARRDALERVRDLAAPGARGRGAGREAARLYFLKKPPL